MPNQKTKFVSFATAIIGAVGFLLLLPLSLLFGQLRGNIESRANISDFPFSVTTYGIQENLPQSQIVDIIKDPLSGELIFSTANGIVKFNGYEFKNYRDHISYRRTIFTRLYNCTSDNQFYAREDNGDISILGDSVVLLGNFMAMDIRGRNHVTIDERGKIEYGHHIPGKRKHIETGLDFPTFLFMLNDSSCLVSAGDDGYLVFLNTGEKQRFEGEKWIAAVQDERTNSVVAITQNKAYRVKDGRLEEIRINTGTSPIFNDVEVVEDHIVFASRKGMFILSPFGISSYSEEDVFPTNILTCLYYDRIEGCLFVGTASRGLLKLIPRRCWSIYKNEPEFQFSYGPMVQLGRGEFLVTADERLILFPERRALDFIVHKELISSLSLFGDTLVVGGRKGKVGAYSLKQKRNIFQSKFGNKAIYGVFRDLNGEFWVGTEEGVYRGKDLLQGSLFLPGQIRKKITTFHEDTQGRLWMGGSHGVFVLDRDRNLIMKFDSGIMSSAQDVRAFYEGASGEIWIGTYGAGLICFRNGKLIALKEKDNYLLGNDVFTLARDKYGYMLMSSNNGIRVVHEQALYDFLNGKTDYLVPFYIGEHSGIFNPESNGGFRNNYCSEKDSVFYFPGIQGYVRYVSLPFSDRTKNFRIDQILLDGKPVDKPFRISRRIKFIRFDFFDTNFSESQNIFYQYRLVNKNDSGDWSRLQKEPFLIFSHLGPGMYQLIIRAIDGTNQKDPPTLTYDFYIPLRFYETIYFYLFVLGGILLLLIVQMEKKFRKQKKEIQRELELKNAITEMQLVAIQSQMNPHFLFNSLNTLVSMISANYLGKAEKFAIDLSQLLRRILEQSSKNFILIQEEIATLTKFMEIQQARFDFDFAIHCPPELMGQSIPTMLLQPLVENAIIHGISHLDGNKGRITLDFSSEKEGCIQLDLRDNGIGLTRSTSIYAGKKKKSMGMEMVRRKIALLQNRYKIQVELTIAEPDLAGQTGTHIRLVIQTPSYFVVDPVHV